MNSKFVFLLPLTFFLLSCGGDEDSVDHNADQISTDTVAIDSIISDIITFPEFAEKCAALEAETNSLDSILNWFDLSKSIFTESEKDSACLIYVAKLFKLSENVWGEYDQEDEFVTDYVPYGFSVGGAEGEIWLIVNTEIAVQNFEDDISTDLREYMRLGEITGEQTSADGGMLMGFEEWGEMLIDLEDRIRANRKSKYYNRFVETYQEYIRWYMWGMENTPIQDWNEPGLNDEVETAYSKMMDDESHRTGLIIQVHWHDMESGSGYNIPWDEQWVPSKEDIEHYFYDENAGLEE